jgi:hypothetical protein
MQEEEKTNVVHRSQCRERREKMNKLFSHRCTPMHTDEKLMKERAGLELESPGFQHLLYRCLSLLIGVHPPANACVVGGLTGCSAFLF